MPVPQMYPLVSATDLWTEIDALCGGISYALAVITSDHEVHIMSADVEFSASSVLCDSAIIDSLTSFGVPEPATAIRSGIASVSTEHIAEIKSVISGMSILAKDKPVSIAIHSADGRLVSQQNLGANKMVIFSTLAKGFYLVTAKTGALSQNTGIMIDK